MPYDQQAMIERIPLYLNGSLNHHEKKEFEDALKHDLTLADEYALMASVNTEFNQHDMPDSDALFAGISDKIDELETSHSSPLKEDNKHSWFDKLLASLLAPQIAWGFASLAIIISVVLPVLQSPSENSEHFQTLSLNNSTNTIIEHRINVIFTPNSSYDEVTTLLTSIDATIVNGPNSIGLVVISVNDVQQAIPLLKNSNKISFVEKKIQ